MDCREARECLVAHLSGELSRREKKRLFSHLAVCSVCSDEKEGLEKIWRLIETLPEIEVPEDLHNATLSRIDEMLRAEKTDRIRTKPDWEKWVPKPLAAVFAAVSMAFFSLWVLRRVTALEQLSDEVVFLCSALWTGVLAGTFLFATGSLPTVGSRWQWASRVGLLSLGLTMLGTLLCPKMNLIEWWESLPPGQFLLSFGQAISHGAFGVIYSLLPLSIAFYFLRRSLKGDLLPHALSAGILFLLLLLPGILLQALPSSPLVFLSWVAGSALGVTIGALSGTAMYKLRPSSTEVCT